MSTNASPSPPPVVVRHNAAAHRFEAEVDGHRAVAEYALEGGRVVLTHTFVPPELRGRGLAEKLVRPALSVLSAISDHQNR